MHNIYVTLSYAIVALIIFVSLMKMRQIAIRKSPPRSHRITYRSR